MNSREFLKKVSEVDLKISETMAGVGVSALRVSLAIIFIWFGILKPIGISPAEPLVVATVSFLPFIEPSLWVVIIGYWEVLIGLTFLFQKTLRLAIALLSMQMVGTFLPLILLPEVTYQEDLFPYGLTMEGQYIIKNLLIISSALLIGGTVRSRRSVVPK